MKTILCLASLLLALCADGAAFYQFNRFTTNFDTTLINGANLTNLTSTNILAASVNSNRFDAATLALFAASGSPTIAFTNFISGKLYTNKTSRLQTVTSSLFLSITGVNGAANMLIQEDQTGGNTIATVASVSYGTVVGLVSDSFIFKISADVAPNVVYAFTNTSTGAGNASSLQGGTGFIRSY